MQGSSVIWTSSKHCIKNITSCYFLCPIFLHIIVFSFAGFPNLCFCILYHFTINQHRSSLAISTLLSKTRWVALAPTFSSSTALSLSFNDIDHITQQILDVFTTTIMAEVAKAYSHSSSSQLKVCHNPEY